MNFEFWIGEFWILNRWILNRWILNWWIWIGESVNHELILLEYVNWNCVNVELKLYEYVNWFFMNRWIKNTWIGEYEYSLLEYVNWFSWIDESASIHQYTVSTCNTLLWLISVRCCTFSVVHELIFWWNVVAYISCIRL